MPSTKLLPSDIALGDETLSTTKVEFSDNELIPYRIVSASSWKREFYYKKTDTVSEGYYYVMIGAENSITIRKLTANCVGSCKIDIMVGTYYCEDPVSTNFFSLEDNVLKEHKFIAPPDNNTTNWKNIPVNIIRPGEVICLHIFDCYGCSDLDVRVDVESVVTTPRTRPVYDNVNNFTRTEIELGLTGNRAQKIFYDKFDNKVYNPGRNSANPRDLVVLDLDDNSFVSYPFPDQNGYVGNDLVVYYVYGRGRNGKIYMGEHYNNLWIIFDPVTLTFEYKTTNELSGGLFSTTSTAGVAVGQDFRSKNCSTTTGGEILLIHSRLTGIMYKINKAGKIVQINHGGSMTGSNGITYAACLFSKTNDLYKGWLAIKSVDGLIGKFYVQDYRRTEPPVFIADIPNDEYHGMNLFRRKNIVQGGVKGQPGNQFTRGCLDYETFQTGETNLGASWDYSPVLTMGPNDVGMYWNRDYENKVVLQTLDVSDGITNKVSNVFQFEAHPYDVKANWGADMDADIPGKAVFLDSWMSAGKYNFLIFTWAQIGTEEY